MKSPKEKKLSDDDRILWNRVARSTKALRDHEAILLSDPEPDLPLAMDKAVEVMIAIGSAPENTNTVRKTSPGLHPFDPQTRNKLSKGRLPIEGTVDLHGLTQSEAHSLLLSFLHRAYGDGMRYVLVITGKGSSLGSEGILRRAVPSWLTTPPFRPLVSSHDSAVRHHGGAGAIYIRLRRRA